MPNETHVTLHLDSASLFEGLKAELGLWNLAEHTFDPGDDEIRVSVDPGGSARITMTINFELTQAQVDRLLQNAQTAG